MTDIDSHTSTADKRTPEPDEQYGYKLYSLTVRDAARARLLEAAQKDAEIIDLNDLIEAGAEAANPGGWLLFAFLICLPFWCLFLLGLVFGGGF